jgi:hypothetical protein
MKKLILLFTILFTFTFSSYGQENHSKKLGDIFAMEADCTFVQSIDTMYAYYCGQYSSFDTIKLYFSMFVNSYSDLEQRSPWQQATDGWVVFVHYENQEYAFLYTKNNVLGVLLRDDI